MSQPQFPQEAFQTLVGKVHAPVFFQKLAADWGVNPQSEEDRAELLEMASVLRNAHQQDQVKMAGSRTSFLKEASDSLKGALKDNGFQHNVPSSNDRLIKEAAMQVIADPDIATAAMEYGQYLSQLENA